MPEEYSGIDKIRNHAYDIVSFVVVFTFLFTVIRYRDYRKKMKTWLAILIGLSCWFIADIIWTFYLYIGEEPFPSPADAFYVIGSISILLGVFLKYLRAGDEIASRDRWNAIFVTAVILLAVVSTVLIQIINSDSPPAEKLLLSFYPICDIAILFFAVTFLSAYSFREEQRSWFFVLIGLCIWTLADVMFAYYDQLGVYGVMYKYVDLIYMAGLLTLGMGAYVRRLLLEGVYDS